MSMNRRLDKLEARQIAGVDREKEFARDRAHASQEALARYDAATERMAAAHEATEADTEKMGDACDEYLDALEYLDNERKEGY